MDEMDRVLQVAQQAARAGGAIARAKIDEPGQYFTWQRSRGVVVDQLADGVEAFQRAVGGIDWPGDMEARKEMLTVVGALVPTVLSVRVIGSPAVGLCYVAAGRLHGYSSLDLRPWDVAPAG